MTGEKVIANDSDMSAQLFTANYVCESSRQATLHATSTS